MPQPFRDIYTVLCWFSVSPVLQMSLYSLNPPVKSYTYYLHVNVTFVICFFDYNAYGYVYISCYSIYYKSIYHKKRIHPRLNWMFLATRSDRNQVLKKCLWKQAGLSFSIPDELHNVVLKKHVNQHWLINIFRQTPNTYVQECVKNRDITKIQNDHREAQHDHKDMENNHKETQTDRKLMQNKYYSFLFCSGGPMKFYLMQCFLFNFDCMTTNSKHFD